MPLYVLCAEASWVAMTHSSFCAKHVLNHIIYVTQTAYQCCIFAHDKLVQRAVYHTTVAAVIIALIAPTLHIMTFLLIVGNSGDSCVHLWDTRAGGSPIQTFRVPHHAAQQVEWNRVNHSLLASAHDNELRIWDTRRAGECYCTSSYMYVFSLIVVAVGAVQGSRKPVYTLQL
jgi:WD40 repeat protein